jgi:hypothetical protein
MPRSKMTLIWTATNTFHKRAEVFQLGWRCWWGAGIGFCRPDPRGAAAKLSTTGDEIVLKNAVNLGLEFLPAANLHTS